MLGVILDAASLGPDINLSRLLNLGPEWQVYADTPADLIDERIHRQHVNIFSSGTCPCAQIITSMSAENCATAVCATVRVRTHGGTSTPMEGMLPGFAAGDGGRLVLDPLDHNSWLHCYSRDRHLSVRAHTAAQAAQRSHRPTDTNRWTDG